MGATDLIEWEDPPAKRGAHQAFFEALRQRPGEWAVWRRGVTSPGPEADRLKKGKFKGIEEGELEVRTYLTPQQGTTIYVRIRGDE